MCGRDFVCVYQYIGEFVRSVWEWQRRGKAKWRLKDTTVFLHLYPQCLPYICLFSMTTRSHFAPADCNLLAVTPHLPLPRAVNCSSFFPLRVAKWNFVAQEMQFSARTCHEWQRPHFNDAVVGVSQGVPLQLPEGSWRDCRDAKSI